ncbi:hypothetical protein J3D55_000285 [Chryseobacterium ginsenosidimutans]|uniref:hypothetical protein n=1 Tax=Chryseobacterium ginsenosidimutans TaxID=687846 RepID=UPI002168AB41|nr:hypothetical protein [Chryseobacterium ginsenosidimutans]MCS3867369.1 hypothetical protein [Chryseobacterium ginsenosidimutans]
MISELKGFNDDIFSGFYILIFMTIIWLPNYLYLRKEKFLNSYFYYNYRNVVFFVGVILIVLSFFIIIANKNRERIFKERGYSQEVIGNGGEEPFDPNKKPDSFEGEVRLWYYNVFEK